MGKIKVGIWGLENNVHIKLYQQLINNNSLTYISHVLRINKNNFYKIKKEYKIFHGITFSRNFKVFLLAKLAGLKTINHWMGSDVEYALKSYYGYFKVKLTSLFIDRHLACSKPLVQELKQIGIKANFMPIINPMSISQNIKPLPEKFSVLAYLPDNRHEFYGSKYIYQLACEYEKINFYIVAGNGGQYPRRDNMIYLGFQKVL